MTSRDQLEQSLEEVRTLAAMGRYVGASLDISDVLKTIARYSTALAESDGAVIVDIHDEVDGCEILAADKVSPAFCVDMAPLLPQINSFIRNFGRWSVFDRTVTSDEALLTDARAALSHNASQLEVAQIEDFRPLWECATRDLMLEAGYQSLLRVNLDVDEVVSAATITGW